jgi:hypothetical protein
LNAQNWTRRALARSCSAYRPAALKVPRVRNDGGFEESENHGACDGRLEKFDLGILDVIEEDELFQEEPRVEFDAEFSVGHADDLGERRVLFDEREIEVDVVLERAAAADSVRLVAAISLTESISTPSASTNGSIVGNGYLRNVTLTLSTSAVSSSALLTSGAMVAFGKTARRLGKSERLISASENMSKSTETR